MKFQDLSFEEILSHVAAQGGGGGDDMDDKAKAAMLLEALSEWQAPIHPFKPGDFIRGKKLLTGRLKGDGLHIVVELLKEPIHMKIDPETCGYSSAVQTYDMIVGHVQEGHENALGVALYYADRREWSLIRKRAS